MHDEEYYRSREYITIICSYTLRLDATPVNGVHFSSVRSLLNVCRLTSLKDRDVCVLRGFIGHVRLLFMLFLYNLLQMNWMNKFTRDTADVHSRIFCNLSPIPSFRCEFNRISFRSFLKLGTIGPDARFDSITVLVACGDRHHLHLVFEGYSSFSTLR